MIKIDGTDLEYTIHDKVALEYYLGGKAETKEQWAKRVWDNCRLYSEGTQISSVYKAGPGQTWQERAIELWENKKSKRRSAISKEFKKDHSNDQDMDDIKLDPKYKTRSERED